MIILNIDDKYFNQISVSFDLYGSGCSSLLENNLHDELSKSFNARVRSWHGPAAGAPVMVQAVMDIYNNLPDEIQQALITFVMSAIKNAIKRFAEYVPILTQLEIRKVGYDIKFYGYEGEEIPLNISEINELVQQIDYFVKREQGQGNNVGKIELPCDLSGNANGDNICNLGYGSKDLWFVSYKDSIEGRLFACYDNANKLLITEVEPAVH